MKEFGLIRTGASVELSLLNKFGGPLYWRSVQTLLKTGTVRAKATITPELSLLSKLGRVTQGMSGDKR